jgi:hypothetical protein
MMNSVITSFSVLKNALQSPSKGVFGNGTGMCIKKKGALSSRTGMFYIRTGMLRIRTGMFCCREIEETWGM